MGRPLPSSLSSTSCWCRNILDFQEHFLLAEGHLSLPLSAGAGIFLTPRNTPYWRRVSLASLWKRREFVAPLGSRREGRWVGPFPIVSALPFPVSLPLLSGTLIITNNYHRQWWLQFITGGQRLPQAWGINPSNSG